MKKIITSIIVCFVAIGTMAQKAQIKVGYEYHFFDPRGIEKRQDFILLAGQDCSKFYNSHTQWLDSTCCTKDGDQWYNQQALLMMGELMQRSREERETILNSSPTGRPVDLYVVRDNDKFRVWDMVYQESFHCYGLLFNSSFASSTCET